MSFRPDRGIVQRQKNEARYEAMCEANLDQCRVERKANWENKTADVIRSNAVKGKVTELLKEKREVALAERRKRLSKLLMEEKDAYEKEIAEVTRPDGAKGRQEMAKRAYELKGRREDERKQLVQEKLYQQWREGIDELRTQDAKLFELKVTFERGIQIDEKEERETQERREDAIYDALWQEGYHAKVERELREKEMRSGLQVQMSTTLGEQIRLKKEMEDDEFAIWEQEKAEMKQQWANADREAKELVLREGMVAKEERKKVDEFKRVCEEEARKEAEAEKQMDRQFVLSVLVKEKALAEKEEADKQLQKKKVLEFNHKLKMDMNRKAESDAELLAIQNAEQERQWQKRFQQWEKEELARRALLEDVYKGRLEQIHVKNEVRAGQRQAILDERERVEAEVGRLEAIDKERARAEAILKKRHQEELFRQMDFHQVQRHRELQQHMIEQRQAMIAEERFRQAKDAEQEKQAAVKRQIEAHQTAKRASKVVAPWDK